MGKMAACERIFLSLLLICPSVLTGKIGIVVEDQINVAVLEPKLMQIIEGFLNNTESESWGSLHLTNELVWRRLNVTNGIYASNAVCDLVKQQVNGLITVLPCRPLKYIISQVDMFHLPHLAVTTEPCDYDQSGLYTLHLTPQLNILTQLVKDVLSKAKSSSTGLIFDSSLTSILRNDLIRTLTDMGSEAALLPVHRHEIGLSKLQRTGARTFIVWTDADNAKAVLHKAKVLNMATGEYSWLVFVDDISLFDVNTIFRSMPSSNAVLIHRSRANDGRCSTAHEQLDDCQNVTIFEATLADAVLYYHVTNTTRMHNTSTADIDVKCFAKVGQSLTWGLDLLNELQTISQTGLIKMDGFDNKGFPKLVRYGLYGIKYDNPLNTTGHLGTWSNNLGLQLTEGKLFLNTFQSFRNERIYVTAREERPFVVKQQVGNETLFTGFVFDILDELSSRLQFRYTVVESEDSRYGDLNQNGSWNGMIRKIIKKDVAMAVGPFAITALRETVVDFTNPFWEDSFGILTLKSQSETGKLFQMMRPFTTDVWVSIAAAMVVVALVSFLSSYFSPYTVWRRESTKVSKKEVSLKENFWIIYSSVIEQGPAFHPSGISSRCILGFWWLFTILIVSTYTANLAAFLTVVDVSSSINNLEELLAQEDLGILIQDGGNVMTVLKQSHNKLYRRVWSKIQQSPYVNNTDSALEYVKTGKYAYIDMKSILDHVAAESCGTFVVSKETFNSGTFGMVIPENAPYREVASYNIMKMLEGGLVDNWQQRWWPKVYNCSSEQTARTGSATSLRLDSLGGLFIVYCAITAAGFLSLVAEIFVRKCYPPRPPK